MCITYPLVSSSTSHPAGAITAVVLRLEVAAEGDSEADAARSASSAAENAAEALTADVDSGALDVDLAARGITTGVRNGPSRVNIDDGGAAVNATQFNTTRTGGGDRGVGGEGMGGGSVVASPPAAVGADDDDGAAKSSSVHSGGRDSVPGGVLVAVAVAVYVLSL